MTESKNITLSRMAFFALVRRAIARTGLPALLSLVCVAPAWAQPPGHAAEGIAVIYPDIGEPYRSVFGQIIGGIEDKARGRVVSFPIGANPNPGELNESLRRQGVRVAIALGRQGMKAASSLDQDIGVVVGGVLAAQEGEVRNMQVNTLSPDPSLLFSRLKEMMPRVRKVFVVYDPRYSEWMVRLAKSAARSQGLELEAFEAQDLRSAMRVYQDILASSDHRQNALWLPQDPTTVQESAVLPMVLQESWARGLAVFSSNPGHVKRGALFSLYPDNVELGRRLAASAQSMLASGEASGMKPLRAVRISVNLRTAKHLGVDASRTQDFDMVFPER